MKNIEVDGQKVRLQIVWINWCSGIRQDKIDSAPSPPPTTSI